MNGAQRIFAAADHGGRSEKEPVRSVVLETSESVIVVWHLPPVRDTAR